MSEQPEYRTFRCCMCPILAESELDAHRKLVALLQERARKKGQIVHWIDVDVWRAEHIQVSEEFLSELTERGASERI